MRKRLAVAFGCALMALGWVGAAGAATHWVSHDGTPSPPGTNCGHPGYSTVQSAVTAAAPGDRIIVCAGTYIEQVTVTKSLRIEGRGNAVIKAPAVMLPPKAIVNIIGPGVNTSLTQLTITGPGGAGCDSIEDGVRVGNGAHATIARNHITEIRDNPFSGCQNGVGIQVGRQAETTSGTADIAFNLIDNYQKNGITVDNVGSQADIFGNTVRGIGPTLLIAQNGIQISREAVGTIDHNVVRDNTYSLAYLGVWSSTGILLYNPGTGVRVNGNDGRRSDDNLGMYGTHEARILHNRFNDSTWYDGIYAASDTTNNWITNNRMHGNREHDCHDDSVGGGTAGTANFWVHNQGETENKPGLCSHDDDDGEHGNN